MRCNNCDKETMYRAGSVPVCFECMSVINAEIVDCVKKAEIITGVSY